MKSLLALCLVVATLLVCGPAAAGEACTDPAIRKLLSDAFEAAVDSVRSLSIKRVEPEEKLCELARDLLEAASCKPAPDRQGLQVRLAGKANRFLRNLNIVDPSPQLIVLHRKARQRWQAKPLSEVMASHLGRFGDPRLHPLTTSHFRYGGAERKLSDGQVVLLVVLLPQYVTVCEAKVADRSTLIVSHIAQAVNLESDQNADSRKLAFRYYGLDSVTSTPDGRPGYSLCKIAPEPVPVVPKQDGLAPIPDTRFPACAAGNAPSRNQFGIDASLVRRLCVEWDDPQTQSGAVTKTPRVLQVLLLPAKSEGTDSSGLVLANIPLECRRRKKEDSASTSERQQHCKEKASASTPAHKNYFWRSSETSCPSISEKDLKELPLCIGVPDPAQIPAPPAGLAAVLRCWLNDARKQIGECADAQTGSPESHCLMLAETSELLTRESPLLGGHPRRRFQHPGTLLAANRAEAMTLELAQASLMASPAHRANILHPVLTHVQLRVCKDIQEVKRSGALHHYQTYRLFQNFFNVAKPDMLEPVVPLRDCKPRPKATQ